MENKFNSRHGNVTVRVQRTSYLPDPGATSPPPFPPCSWLLKAAVLVQLQTLSASGQTGVGQTGPALWSHPSCRRTILPCRFPPQTHSQRFRLPDRPKEQSGWRNCAFLTWCEVVMAEEPSPQLQSAGLRFRAGWAGARHAWACCTASEWRGTRKGCRYLAPRDARCSLGPPNWIWEHTHITGWVSVEFHPQSKKILNCDFFFFFF